MGEQITLKSPFDGFELSAYHARPTDATVIAATTDYGGPFCSAVRRGRLFATQFHPEKSQAYGLALLARFLEWRP